MSDPVLEQAAEEIKEVLRKHDIAGACMLIRPAHGEYFFKLRSSWSCIEIEENRLRIVNTDKPVSEREKFVTQSCEMVMGLIDMGEALADQLKKVRDVFSQRFKISHFSRQHPPTNPSDE